MPLALATGASGGAALATTGPLIGQTLGIVAGAGTVDAAAGAQGVTTVAADDEGAFSVWNWSGYPEDFPKPEGPFRLITDPEYSASRAEADAANRALHQADPALQGLDMHEIQPVKFGGSPTDLANKIAPSRAEHVGPTTWWNQLMAALQGH